jgi:flagellar biosynthesis repressor protein FlbT
MKKGMQISLKPGERVFINGAVLRVDRKVSIELMNDVTFLLEAHVMQPEEAKTPVRQLYFILQAILMDPAGVENTMMVFERTHGLLRAAFENTELEEGLRLIGEQVAGGRSFDALKTVRALIAMEDAMLAAQSEEDEKAKREVA